jgi:hypothetical protein
MGFEHLRHRPHANNRLRCFRRNELRNLHSVGPCFGGGGHD